MGMSKEQLELASLVMGTGFSWHQGQAVLDNHVPNYAHNIIYWDPEDNDSDSRQLEIACYKWLYENETWGSLIDCYLSHFRGFDSQFISSIRKQKPLTGPEFRLAILDVAIQIGQRIKDGAKSNV